jgi:hypothetical protein
MDTYPERYCNMSLGIIHFDLLQRACIYSRLSYCFVLLNKGPSLSSFLSFATVKWSTTLLSSQATPRM